MIQKEEEGMRLPGTRYQEPGWEQVRKLLGACSLEVFGRCDPLEFVAPAPAAQTLALYVDLLAEQLYAAIRSARAQAQGNSYGDSVVELALSLAYELAARPADWVMAAVSGAAGLKPALAAVDRGATVALANKE